MLEALIFTCLMLALSAPIAWVSAVPGEDLMDVDYRSLVSQPDLDYNKPVSTFEEGLPVGNAKREEAVR